MKKVVLIALTVLTVVACKKSVTTVLDTGTVPISLSAGAPISKVPNMGVRSKLFELSDQIGVVAALSDNAAMPATEAPDWTKAVYFDNSASCCMSNTSSAPEVSKFSWGEAGAATIAESEFYPSKDGKIFLFAYSPYSIAKADPAKIGYIAPDGTSSKPSLAIDLKDGKVEGEPTTDASALQPDVLWYAGTTPVSSSVPTTCLNFNHALAQLQFKVYRSEGSSSCKLVSIVFKTVKSGTMDITTGAFTYPTETGYETAAVYTITPKTGLTSTEIPALKTTDVATQAFDVLKANGCSPLMILPLDMATAQKGYLEVTCDYAGTGAAPSTQTFKCDLSTLGAGHVAGKLNTFNIKVSLTGIAIEATIAEWATDGTSSDLETE
ncbi:MAG: fimbrillin family protein [Mucinivorans sp.]